jgi:hypothetical protein|tara:strand:+ start:575 stop:1021 length:447 start_codon:yes stop_codon:yes gene_type:complete
MSKNIYTTVFMLFCIVASRLLPHPPNFTPVIAVFMMSGMVSLLPCLIAYIISDAIIGFHSYMLWVYGSLFAIAYLQRGAIFSATLFFVVTNFAVWTGGWYGYTLEGLITCYIMAIPFFVNMLLSTLIFSEMFKYFQKHTFVIPQIKFA